MNGVPEASAATEANGEPTVREFPQSAGLAPSPRCRAEQEAALATAVGHLSRQDVADVLQRQGTGSDDGDWDYELEHYDQINLKRLIHAEVKDALRKVIAKQKSPGNTLMRDKLTFAVVSVDLYFTAYWLGSWPESFWQLYIAKAAVLFLIRWVVYRYKRWHYYLFDLCYAAQVVLMLQLWLFPTNIPWIKARRMTFGLNLGPLVWSIIAFRNSLVYHSLDKMTSHFLHWTPACVSYAARWHPPPQLRDHLASSSAARLEWESGGFWDFFLLPLLPYLLWALLYYLKVFVISSGRIEQRGYVTLFKFATASRKSLFGSVVLRFPPRFQPLVYMSMHVALGAATLLFTALWWKYKIACEIFLVAQFGASAWSGATFYFDVFSRRYIAGLSANSAKNSAVDLRRQGSVDSAE
ncbi:hypothetical protein QBZ16_003792 [Prototheca wickerhamii]|uniref:Glycerophosphocholine acyltransferase 1 n=1 Tax=Prototheca wickerhamii TaxID=3111 RepID=A0AAD9MH34_PROWI|nr:hypothetical protein QBZ16_003792 [Prototheca wickerhamii]